MRILMMAGAIAGSVCIVNAQMTNGVPETRAAPVVAVVVEAPFVAPPVVETPAVTNEVVVVESVVTTNVVTVLKTNLVERREWVVATNSTLRRFVIDIDANQTPTRFTSYMSDGSVIVTAAGDVASLSNRPALSTFNGLLRDVIGNGRRNVNTNAWWQARGTNGAVRMQRVWSSAGGHL